ncbi:uncharacterized protein N7482_007950 [Penicillium canariense]|uniref:Uncharacterized protein n=1 Tax=Penicillium canariense TaxID=189055 RepID=A0A9W9I020_9EURO|nr:uncharacterized protein N7482_007950 [Penicillium canariense]KAJ5160946.1 hypothetical protein N7482_007950 [Penicillium canariense]
MIRRGAREKSGGGDDAIAPRSSPHATAGPATIGGETWGLWPGRSWEGNYTEYRVESTKRNSGSTAEKASASDPREECTVVLGGHSSYTVEDTYYFTGHTYTMASPLQHANMRELIPFIQYDSGKFRFSLSVKITKCAVQL